MRRFAFLALIGLSTLLLAGCGDDSGDIVEADNSPTTEKRDSADTTVPDDSGDDEVSPGQHETLVDYLSGDESSFAGDEEAQCIAEQVENELSDDSFEGIADSAEFGLTDFADEDVERMVAAIDDCVDLDDAVNAFGEGIASADNLPMTAEEANCAAESFAADFDGAGEFVQAISEMDEEEAGIKMLDSMGECISDETAIKFVEQIIQQQGVSKADSNCVAKESVNALGKTDLMGAIAAMGAGDTTGAKAAAFTKALTAAATTCGVNLGAGAGGSGGGVGGGIGG